MRPLLLLLGLAVALASGARADIAPRPGWQVVPTEMTFPALVAAVKDATRASGMNVVTEAGPTDAAAQQGVTLPGNRVIGVFHVGYAIRILPLSTAAMIEAPLRLYVTEESDGTATLSWKEPTFVFAPYFDEGGDALKAAAAELDKVIGGIASKATGG
jgi:uncharacterized protein (DUF302 family)